MVVVVVVLVPVFVFAVGCQLKVQAVHIGVVVVVVMAVGGSDDASSGLCGQAEHAMALARAKEDDLVCVTASATYGQEAVPPNGF
ncbi:hypothetical protein BJ912DRAFT_1061538 [Pholiota molesta]|nr:hypothetical protein BJ912DRAFT_1061538 [Pholiota molesta]